MNQLATDFVEFLLEAKRRTYAGLDDDASVAVPLLSGSKQLEHHRGAYRYRDIYFGIAFFVGQETVSIDGSPIWSMSYAGGVKSGIAERSAFLAIYAFLRQALLRGSADMPYRGPPAIAAQDMTYLNAADGNIEQFHGREQVLRGKELVYELRYVGGTLR